MQNNFKNFLIERKLKLFTNEGKPSTVYDYLFRVNQVRMAEKLTWEDMKKNISQILPKYAPLSEKWAIGKRSHESVYNALRYFNEFAMVNVQ